MRCGHAELPLVSPFDAPSGANDVPSIYQALQASVRQQKSSVAVLSEACIQVSTAQPFEEGSNGTIADEFFIRLSPWTRTAALARATITTREVLGLWQIWPGMRQALHQTSLT